MKPYSHRIRTLRQGKSNPFPHLQYTLTQAVYGKNVEDVKLLLDCKADVNDKVRIPQNELVIHTALCDGQRDMIQVLVSAKADINQTTEVTLFNALHIVCRNCHPVELLSSLGNFPYHLVFEQDFRQRTPITIQPLHTDMVSFYKEKQLYYINFLQEILQSFIVVQTVVTIVILPFIYDK